MVSLRLRAVIECLFLQGAEAFASDGRAARFARLGLERRAPLPSPR
jgi:hypothetical protein